MKRPVQYDEAITISDASDDTADDAGEAAGGGVAAAGGSSAVFLRLRNIDFGSCERCFFCR